MGERRAGWKRGGAVWLVAAALMTGVVGCEQGGTTGDDAEQVDDQAERADGEQEAPRAAAGVADLVEEVAPSVVSVLVGAGQGSGIIYDAEGLVVTNAHVALQGDALVVAFADGRRVDAELVAADERSDIAVLSVDVDRQLPAAAFQEELPRVGDAAVAIGTPLGLENSVTAGIISGLDRSLPGAAAAGIPALVGLIQTDAGLSPGNSGGALVNADGDVVGMNVAVAAGSPDIPVGSIGFAIPAAMVLDVVDQLLATGEVEHPFLGVQLAPLTPAVHDRLDAPVDQGALVLAVVEGTPAHEAQIQPGDVLVGLDDTQITEPGDLLAALRDHAPGDAVTITLYRDGDERTVEVTLGRRDVPDGGGP